MDRFNRALAFTLAEEGGYSNDPADSGGPTNWGITIGDLERWRRCDCSADDVRAVSRDEAAAIYHAIYWTPLRCGELRPGLDLLVFDCAVNPGQGWTARTLQACAGVVPDGVLGPVTMTALDLASSDAIIMEMSSERADYYRSRSAFRRFGAGWLARAHRCQLAALSDVGV